MLVSRVLELALNAAGVLGDGQTASAGMTARAFDSINAMIGQWAAKRYMLYHLVNTTITATGAKTYNVGPIGDFVLPSRPVALESAYVSMNSGTPSQIDTPLQVIKSFEDFNSISLKSVVAFPYAVYYDESFPEGTLYVWPVASNLYTLTITTRMALSAFAAVTSDVSLPVEYQEPLIYSLAARLQVLYQVPIDAGVVGLAKEGMNTVRTANAQIPLLSLPATMNNGTRFNVYAGR